MSLVVRLLYSVLDSECTLTTDEAKADWLAKYVPDIEDSFVPLFYGMCTAYSHACGEKDVFNMLVDGAADDIPKQRKTLLAAIETFVKSKGRAATLHCAKCHTELDITTTIIQNRSTGKIFCVQHGFGKPR